MVYNKQSGFAHLLLLLFVVLATIGILFIFFRVRGSRHQAQTLQPVSKTAEMPVSAQAKPEVTWHTTNNGWEPSSTPPVCPAQPIFDTPVDMSLVSSILYPGQVRGNAFKPHGGFRFDTHPNNDITLKMPMDAKLMRAGKTLVEENGEVQYGFEFIAPCGIWFAFGHIHTPSPTFQAYVDKMPLVTEHGTQQMYDVTGSPDIKKSEVIASQVGIIHTKNVFVEWQVNDLRQKNGLTIRPEWSKYTDQFDKYGVCWLDWLPAADAARAKVLPGGDSVSGKKSDYCK